MSTAYCLVSSNPYPPLPETTSEDGALLTVVLISQEDKYDCIVHKADNITCCIVRSLTPFRPSVLCAAVSTYCLLP